MIKDDLILVAQELLDQRKWGLLKTVIAAIEELDSKPLPGGLPYINQDEFERRIKESMKKGPSVNEFTKYGLSSNVTFTEGCV